MSDHATDASERVPGDVPEEALVIFEPASGGIVYVNAAASELFGISSDRPGKARASELIPELSDPTPRRFGSVYRYPSGPRDIDVWVEGLGAGQLARGVALLARIRPRIELPVFAAAEPGSELATRGETRLESLWSLVIRGGFAGNDRVSALLREAAAGIGLDHAALARVEGDELVVAFASDTEQIGTRSALDRSPAGAAVRRAGTFAVLDTAQVPEFAPMTAIARAFLASAFRVGDEQWAVTLWSMTPRVAPFSQSDWSYVDTVVEALGRAVERLEKDRQIEQLAYYDGLTALPNRIALMGRMDEAIADAERTGGRMAVLFLDIDGFKGVNDTVGHRGGDIVLAEVAQRLRGTLRRDEYIGRLGGDEFAIVMPAVTDRHEIDSIAQRIGGVLTFPFGIDDYRFSLSASIGVAIYPDDAAGREELLASADAAMYSAKDDGGSRVRFRDSRDPLTESLPAAALAAEPRDSGYILCYQPVVDLATNRVVSAEALIRRIHPQHGLLAPERGWSIARDEAGRRALDRWVLREATSQLRTWQQAGLSLRIDVNLAAFETLEIDKLLEDPGSAATVRRLRIEIAQEQFADPERAEIVGRFVEHCAANGVGFVLDGFDGGLATLSSLSNLPIDAVKLDRPLVDGVITSRTTRAVVVGTIIVAKSLGWSVIAKGVETAAQQEALVALGCDAIQGYFVAHPMTAVDFGTWLRGRDLVGREA